jgi:hypothetical protein
MKRQFKILLFLIGTIQLAMAGPFAYKRYVHYDFKSEIITADQKSSDYAANIYSRSEYSSRYDDYSKIQFFVKKGCGHHKITKPFVFVEGVSFDNNVWTQADYTINSYFHSTQLNESQEILKNSNGVEKKWENFQEMIDAYNSVPSNVDHQKSIGFSTFNWGTLVSGIDVEGLMNGEPLQVQKCPELLNKLYDNGYDIIFVDFQSGQNFMENNGYALTKVLKIIKDSLDDNSSTEKLVVCGASMGGLVSRFAIKELELNGGSNYDHCVGKFISFDSPQMGANINLGLQYLLQDLTFLEGSTIGSFDALKEKYKSYEKLTCPSASQLVLFSCLHNKLNYLLPVDYSDASESAERTTFRNHPNIATWPQNCKKFSIINGSRKGYKQSNGGFNDCDMITDVDGCLDVNIKSLPKNGDGYCRIFNLNVPPVLAGIPIIGSSLLTITKSMSVRNSLAVDMVSGSYRTDLQQLTTLNKSVNFAIGNLLGPAYMVNTVFNGYTTNAPNFCFIPALSAAGIIDFNNKVESSDTELPALFNDSYRFSDPNHNKSYFDAVYAPEHNQTHVEITDENIAWVMEILDNCDAEKHLFQNETINSDDYIACKYIKAGSDVGKGNGEGNAIVAAQTAVSFTAYDYIDLQPGFEVQPGGVFNASIIERSYCASGNRLANNAGQDDQTLASIDGQIKSKDIKRTSNQKVPLEDASVQLVSLNTDIKLIPNPTQENTMLRYQLKQHSEVSISIRSIMGAEYGQQQSQLYQSAGEHSETLQTAALPKGVYIVTLTTKEGSISKRLIKN